MLPGGVQGPAGGKPGPTKLWARGQGDRGRLLAGSSWPHLTVVSSKSPLSLPPGRRATGRRGVGFRKHNCLVGQQEAHGPSGRIGPQEGQLSSQTPALPHAWPRTHAFLQLCIMRSCSPTTALQLASSLVHLSCWVASAR